MSRLFLLNLVAATSACVLPSEPVERLDLSMRLSGTRMRPDSAVVVEVTATNSSPRPILLETTGGCVVAFALQAPGGADVGPAFGCQSILRRVEIGPGETKTATYVLLPTPRYSPSRGLIRWPAGTYEVIGQLLNRDLEVLRTTEPAQFELVCGDPTWTEC